MHIPVDDVNIWRIDPRPNRLVAFTYSRRLTLRSGKSLDSHVKGDLLMENYRESISGTVWANQDKGNRVRIVGFDGYFMFPGAKWRILRRIIPNGGSRETLGWVSDRDEVTGEYLLRRKHSVRMYSYWN